ncbi:hypothetical protein Mal4_39350 [Maioricimonas rarisocia]|uniref:DUF1549 domain-containing protein n=2 Tax=Maioricimonas rarisocia TaxID=2528026 RepID=A0A517ZAY2_9PLAN|nr:hypothetical protein Mal4_39350 [Maioricimonas rarisocia]
MRILPAAIALLCIVGVAVDASLAADLPVGQIDRFIEQKWQQADVQPAEPISDSRFVRRLYLDLVGRIPTPQERETFLADQRPDKREHLVDLLLGSEDHVVHFADLFDTLLMGRGSDRDYCNRREHQWRSWLEQAFRENRPWDEVVQEILLARPASPDERGTVWFLYERENDHQKIAEAVAPAFFGIRIECAQCHDHMLAGEIEQRHYWGLVAFFNRSENAKTENGPRVKESAIGGFSEFAKLSGESTPNLLTFFGADVVDEPRPDADQKQEDLPELYVEAALKGEPQVPKFSRREQFVSHVANGHPLIARAFVNRMWAILLGRGIVHPFDEMDSTHEPSHPELLDWLAQDFRDSGHDIRRLIRMIVLSRHYALDSRRPEGIDDPALFAWSLERPLTAEQLARSMQVALHGSFRNDHPLFRQLRETLPDVLPETVGTGVDAALFLSNNPAVNTFIAESDEPSHLIPRIQQLDTPAEQVTALIVTLFGRPPADDEIERIAGFVATAEPGSQARSQRWQHVVWALLTSAEFRFNH